MSGYPFVFFIELLFLLLIFTIQSILLDCFKNERMYNNNFTIICDVLLQCCSE